MIICDDEDHDAEEAEETGEAKENRTESQPQAIRFQRVGYGINSNGTWITFQGEDVLWLPPEFRPATSKPHDVVTVKVTDLSVAISGDLGRVALITFSKSHRPF